MNLEFLQENEQKIKTKLVKRFREERIRTLRDAEQTKLICPDGVSYVQELLYDYLYFIGIDSTQKVKIRIINNMSEDDLYYYVEYPDRFTTLLKKTITNMKNKKLNCEGFSNILSKLNIRIGLEV